MIMGNVVDPMPAASIEGKLFLVYLYELWDRILVDGIAYVLDPDTPSRGIPIGCVAILEKPDEVLYQMSSLSYEDTWEKKRGRNAAIARLNKKPISIGKQNYLTPKEMIVIVLQAISVRPIETVEKGKHPELALSKRTKDTVIDILDRLPKPEEHSQAQSQSVQM